MAHIKKFEHLKIPLETIRSATNTFADESCVGKGGFGKVYKVEVIHRDIKTVVALKRLDRFYEPGYLEFSKEIIMLSSYRHEYIVSLLGYCDDLGEKILVYEYVSKKIPVFYLNKGELSWVRLFQICVGAARGLVSLRSAEGLFKEYCIVISKVPISYWMKTGKPRYPVLDFPNSVVLTKKTHFVSLMP